MSADLKREKKITNNLKTIGVFKDFLDGSIKTVLKALNKGVIEVK